MNRLKQMAAAMAVVAGAAGCAANPVALQAPEPAAQAVAGEQSVSRALPSYGTYGGYRYRRFSAEPGA